MTEDTSSSPADGTSPDIFLHIGTMKTGTSFLQQVLERNPEALQQDGAVFLDRPRAFKEAVLGLQPEDRNSWDRMVRAAHGFRGKTVAISSELLSFANDETARRIVESFAPSRVTVIVTARDVARLIPSAWQNKVKHGRPWTFASYVQSVMTDPGSQEPDAAHRAFWHHHDLGTIVRRWAALTGPEDLVVIPVPGRDAGPDALWERFASVVGLTSSAYNTVQDRRSNISLDYRESELLRRVNHRLRDEFKVGVYHKIIQRTLANQLLRPDPSTSSEPIQRPQLTPEVYEWARRRSQELADEVRAAGVRVVGDLDELVPRPMTEAEAEAARNATVPEIPDVYVEVIAALIRTMIEERQEAEEALQGTEPRGDKRRQRKKRKLAAAEGNAEVTDLDQLDDLDELDLH